MFLKTSIHPPYKGYRWLVDFVPCLSGLFIFFIVGMGLSRKRGQALVPVGIDRARLGVLGAPKMATYEDSFSFKSEP